MPASLNACFANRWCSASVSTVVRTPSGRMPRSSQSPETPVPVPISTTARASIMDARNRNTAPPPLPIGATPTSLAQGPGSREDVVLADELLGVGPAGGLHSRGDDGLLGRCALVPHDGLGGTLPSGSAVPGNISRRWSVDRSAGIQRTGIHRSGPSQEPLLR